MNNAERIDEIKAKGTWLYLSKGEKVERFVLIVLSALTVALVGGFVVDKIAVSNVAACTNRNLSTRNAPATNDADAHIAYAQANASWVAAISAAFSAPPGEGPTEFAALQKATLTYQTATNRYTATLQADNTARVANPLGKC